MGVGTFLLALVVLSGTLVSMIVVWRDPNGPTSGWVFPWWWRNRPLKPYQATVFRIAAIVFGGFSVAMLIALFTNAVA